MSRITLWGFYQWDKTILESFDFPSAMDKKLMRDVILEKSGDLYPYYQQPDYLKQNINNWFKRLKYNFQMMFDALNAEYNPIENYDRYKKSTETPNITNAMTSGGSDSSTQTAEQGNTVTSQSSQNIENKISGYNSSDYAPDNQSQQSGNGSTTTTTNGSDTLKKDYGRTETNKETGTRTYESHTHGNIGVTTNQQMIQAELELRLYDLYDTIANEFEKKFILQVY